MFYWSQIPLVRIILPLILGIILFKTDEQLLSDIAVILLNGILLFLLIIAMIGKKWLSYKNRWFFGFLANGLLVLLGYSLCFHYNISNKIDSEPSGKFIWLGKVVESPSKTAKSVKTIIELEQLKAEGKRDLIQQKILAYLPQDSSALSLQIGDIMVCESYFQKIAAAQNPAQFDYSEFMANRGVYLQSYIPNWQLVGSEPSLFRTADKLRKSFLEVFKLAGLNGDNFAVASALTLGYDNSLDYQLQNAYSGSGAMHILSVSGLHVGIVYLVLLFLTHFMKKNRHLRLLQSLLLLTGLWFYALVTGLSPPVQRSAFMFSFIVVAEYMGRNNNIFNSLAGSILILILINPNILFEVGFQLSYAAVLGIVLIHPRIYPMLYFKSWLADSIWNLTLVSIAAQLATLPFALYYFHQFPNFFLLTNLIAVPLSFVVLLAALALLLVYSVFGSTFILGALLKFFVIVLNKSVIFFYELPFSLTDGIYISAYTAALLFAVIVFFILYLHFYQPKFLLVSLMFLCIISLGQLWEHQLQKDQSLLTVYNLRRGKAISSVSGQTAVVLADFNRYKRSAATVSQHLASIGVSDFHWINTDSVSRHVEAEVYYRKNGYAAFLFANQMEFLIPTKEIKKVQLPKKQFFENLLINQNFYEFPCVSCSTIVMNPSIPEYQKRWMQDNALLCADKVISQSTSICWSEK